MDVIRIGRTLRALRIRRRWRQIDLANAVGCSQALIARVERGGADKLTGAMLERIVAELGARLVVRVDWNGEAADRLLDADHALLVDAVLRILRAAGWEAIPEVTFAIDRERGSIDILAWHDASRTLLVIEVKSVVPDVQSTLSTFDRKIRLAPGIGRERGWPAAHVAALLVIGGSSTARRRVAAHAATFDARLPARAREIRRFLANPARLAPLPPLPPLPRLPQAGSTTSRAVGLRGLWFLPVRTGASSRERVNRVRAAR